MGWNFRKSVKILPGVRINFGKRGVSASIGTKGAHVNINSKGQTRFTAGIPGTGLSYTTRLDKPTAGGMTQCPYCGHKMRKQWDNCPKCEQSLIQVTEPPKSKDEIIAQMTDEEKVAAMERGKQKVKGCCGCLVMIVLFFMFCAVIGSCSHNDSTVPENDSIVPENDSTVLENGRVEQPVTQPAPQSDIQKEKSALKSLLE